LKEVKVEAERKVFEVTARENAGGRLIRISEFSKGRWNKVIIPVESLSDVVGALAECGRAAES